MRALISSNSSACRPSVWARASADEGVLRLEEGQHLGVGAVVAAQPRPGVDPLVAVEGAWCSGRRGACGGGHGGASVGAYGSSPMTDEKPHVYVPPGETPPADLVIEDLEVGRRRRGGRGPAGRGPLRRRVVAHPQAVRRQLGPRRHLRLQARRRPGHQGLGRGRGRHEGRRSPAHRDPAAPRLRQARAPAASSAPTRRSSSWSTSSASAEPPSNGLRALPGRPVASLAVPERPSFRAPKGTQDVLPPESARWEAFARPSSPSSPSATATGWSSRRCSRTSACSSASARAPTSSPRRCTTSRTRAAAASPCGPRAPRRWPGPSSSTSPPTPWKVWYATPAFRYERPQAGRLRQHHQVGIEAIGIGRPRPRRRGHRLRRGASSRPSASQRWRLVLNFMGTPADRAALRRRRCGPAARPPRRARARGRREARGAPAPGPRLEARRPRRAVLADAPAIADSLDAASVAHGERVQAGLRRARHRLRARPHASCAASTTTRTPSSSSRATRSATPSPPSAAAAATTASSSSSAARPRPASASAAASSASSSPATPRACSPRPSARVDVLRRRHHRRRGGRARSRTTLRAAGVARRPRLRRPVDEGADEGGRRSGRPLRR